VGIYGASVHVCVFCVYVSMYGASVSVHVCVFCVYVSMYGASVHVCVFYFMCVCVSMYGAMCVCVSMYGASVHVFVCGCAQRPTGVRRGDTGHGPAGSYALSN
jgi:hypothetical protein